jgi:hypothetical protein
MVSTYLLFVVRERFLCITSGSIHDFLCITVAAAFPKSLRQHGLDYDSAEKGMIGTDLMIREYERIRKYNILSPSRRENNNFRDVIWRQRLTPGINRVGLCFISTKPYNGELLKHVISLPMLLP